MAAVIEKLVKVYPQAVTARDRNGMTPLNLAIQNGADIFTIRILDRAAQETTVEKTISFEKPHACDASPGRNSAKTEAPSTLGNSGIDRSMDAFADSEDDISSVGSDGCFTRFDEEEEHLRGLWQSAAVKTFTLESGLF